MTEARERILLAVVVMLCASGAAYGMVADAPRVDPSLSLVVDGVTESVRAADRVGQTVTRLSTRDEIAIGNRIARNFESGITRGKPADEAYVSAVLARLLGRAHLRRSDVPYEVHVLDSHEINAFAVPGGHLYVTTSLLELVESEAELAYVLGHEVAHVDMRHAIERVQYGVAARRVGGDPLEALANVGTALVQQGFSSELELEADRRGIVTAFEAGYHPEAAAVLQIRWRKVVAGDVPLPRGIPGEASEAMRGALEDYFGSHPDPVERIALVDRVIAEQGIGTPSGRPLRGYVGARNLVDRRVVVDDRDAAELVVGSLR